MKPETCKTLACSKPDSPVSENDPNNTKQKPWAINYHNYTQPAFTCPKLTIETLEQGVKYVQS